MKLLFIAGCLEPGASGVGDYTSFLAAACMKRGHSCGTVALNDPWVKEVEGSMESSADSPTRIRFPNRCSSAKRDEGLMEIMERLRPDWVSIQFVPYAFEQRGFIWPKLRKFSRIIRRSRVHVMFHELWIGEYQRASIREKVIGQIQRRMIQWFVRACDAAKAHTSNPLYQSLLAQASIRSEVLPMFGTVRIGMKNADEWLFPILKLKDSVVTLEYRDRYWLIGLFGSIHNSFPYKELLGEIVTVARQLDRTPVLLSIGEIGSGLPTWEMMERSCGSNIVMKRLGQQTEERASQLFNSLDFGITSTPLDIIGKSSSVATMLEHGLPVVSADEGGSGWSVPDLTATGIFSRRQFFNEKRYLNTRRRRAQSGVDAAADQFLTSLNPGRQARPEMAESISML